MEQLEKHDDSVYTLRHFMAILRERQSNPLYDKVECEKMIKALELALEALEVQIYA